MQIFTKLIKSILVVLILSSSVTAQENSSQMSSTEKEEIAFLLFDNYETLDVFGPAEIFGRLTDLYALKFYSLEGGIVTNRHKVTIMTEKLADINKKPFAFPIPGGLGTRIEVNNDKLITSIKDISLSSTYVMTVCTGSALLAKTGLLNKRMATSNKRAFAWVATNGPDVQWDKEWL